MKYIHFISFIKWYIWLYYLCFIYCYYHALSFPFQHKSIIFHNFNHYKYQNSITKLYINNNSKNEKISQQIKVNNKDNTKLSEVLSILKDSFNDNMLTTSAIMFIISAPLGMFLDNYHGLFHVLTYQSNGLPFVLEFSSTNSNDIWLTSAIWVPIVFGIAGYLMSMIILILDSKLYPSLSSNKDANNNDMIINNLTWPKIFYGISYFSFQYYLSGLFDYQQVDNLNIHIILASIAWFGYYIFDNTKAGLTLSILTGILGPLIEILLINIPHLYQYTHADFYGICSWIPWVYFLGGPAVGNLARGIYKLF